MLFEDWQQRKAKMCSLENANMPLGLRASIAHFNINDIMKVFCVPVHWSSGIGFMTFFDHFSMQNAFSCKKFQFVILHITFIFELNLSFR